MVLASHDTKMNTMKQNEESLLSDDARILQFLMSRPYEFISQVEISRMADGESRFAQEPNWARPALSRLLALDIVETDAAANFRFKITRPVTKNGSAKNLKALAGAPPGKEVA
jgi:hypothetical protein